MSFQVDSDSVIDHPTDEGRDNYQQAYEGDNKAELSHEILAGGASFMAMKMFEDHQRKEGKHSCILTHPISSLTTNTHPGKPVSHQFAKELLAGFAGGEVDRLAETKGADYIDREKAKRQARENAEQMYDQHYGDNDQYDPNQQEPPRHLREHFNDNNW
jgi:hypothetical protein